MQVELQGWLEQGPTQCIIFRGHKKENLSSPDFLAPDPDSVPNSVPATATLPAPALISAPTPDSAPETISRIM